MVPASGTEAEQECPNGAHQLEQDTDSMKMVLPVSVPRKSPSRFPYACAN